MWGFGGGFAASEFSFSGAVPSIAGAQHQKTNVIKRSWYQSAGRCQSGAYSERSRRAQHDNSKGFTRIGCDAEHPLKPRLIAAKLLHCLAGLLCDSLFYPL
ncbi:hypothetical protein SE17_27320 [Kouleothrix aurantiaca]|uniref:Uncharacterized protein n=1 Tax=Kouleothrix aurantiaca TaxID=186479 RepID=A0A0N8PRM9_9CHLR|nr:hypothetical protein SE17_27320 [Kouleothrix aurantiaca]